MTIKQQLGYTLRRMHFPGSANYWERRYATGGDSGAGSYGDLAMHKATILNKFVTEHEVQTIIELGCGDGHQLTLADYPDYVGFDVSKTAVAMCSRRFTSDPTKKFYVHKAGNRYPAAELALSLDVIYHLVEDDVFEQYMNQLFDGATRYVAIFARDAEERTLSVHVRHRNFTSWIATHRPTWASYRMVRNPHAGSPAQFYFYENSLATGANIAKSIPATNS